MTIRFNIPARAVMMNACRRATVLALAASLLVGCKGGGSDDPPADATQGSVTRDGSFHPTMRGTWRMLGEGKLVHMTPTAATFYEETQSLCYAAGGPVEPATFADMSFTNVMGVAPQRVEIFGTADSPAQTTLERIDAIPQRCLAAPPADPLTTFKTLWETMDRYYAFFELHGIDWAARYTELAPQAALATGPDELDDVIRAALGGLHDGHLTVRRGKEVVFNGDSSPTPQMIRQALQELDTPKKRVEWYENWIKVRRDGILAQLTGGSGKYVLEDKAVWGRLPGNVGYIGIDAMDGYGGEDTEASKRRLIGQTIDQAIAELADTGALIVDISHNVGGLDAVGAEIAARFADQRRLAFTKQKHQPEGGDVQSWYIEPKGPRQYLKPVYLLTTDLSVSAAEAFTLMMREFPHVTQVGQRTNGALSDILGKTLPGGYSMGLSHEIYLDPRGELYEGFGIPPRLPITMYDSADISTLHTGHAATLAKLLRHIGQQ